MDIHYNAFISYRHHPRDMRVAAEIHRSLEHYRVPKALRNETNRTMRLFRDKEELPITSDLSGDIIKALNNSDYLIVICSTHTKESIWVQREIEAFLRTHDRSKVLTVLVDGEPYDTIPEILLKEERTDPVTGETTTVPIEPLSCDWRQKHRIAKRVELPRLAAVLLHCSYDELRQREKQYRARRMLVTISIALAISISFMAYFIYSGMQIRKANAQLRDANIEIQNNLDKALENQSLFLANAATQLLEDGDRLTAMLLSLEALPEYPGERPYVADAEAALSSALGLYSANEEIAAVGAFTCDAEILDFKVTDDGKTIYIVDRRNVLSVWDTDTFQRRSSASLSFMPNDLQVTTSGNLLVYHNNERTLTCYNSKCEALWSTPELQDYAFLNNKEILMLLVMEETSWDEPNRYTTRFLQPDTGKEVKEAISYAVPQEGSFTVSFLQEAYDDTIVCIVFNDWEQKIVAALDIDSGSYTLLTAVAEGNIEASCFSNDGNLLLLIGELSLSGWIMDMRISEPFSVQILCIDCTNGAILWQTEFTAYGTSLCSTLQTIPESGNIFCQDGSTLAILDSTTGEILQRNETGESPVAVNVSNPYIHLYFTEGSLGNFDYKTNELVTVKRMKEDISKIQINHGAYISTSLSTQVVLYRSVRDDEWQRFRGDYGEFTGKATATCGNLLAVEAYTALYLFDTEKQELIWKDGNGDYSFDTEVLGFSEDGGMLWCIQNEETLVTYDTASGSKTSIELPELLGKASVYYQCQHRMIDHRIFCIAKDAYAGQYLFCYDTETAQEDYREICVEQNVESLCEWVFLAAFDNDVLLWEKDSSTVYEFDLLTGELIAVLKDVDTKPAAEICDQTRYVLGVNHEIQFRSWGGNVLLQIDLVDQKAGAFCIHDEQIFALCDDGGIYRYDMNGVFLSKTETHIYNSFYNNLSDNPEQIQWSFTKEGDLIINIFGYGNIIDGNCWKERASFTNFVSYAENQNMFIVKSSDKEMAGIGAYCYYTTQEIIAKAKETLGDLKLTDEQRTAYGLLEDES